MATKIKIAFIVFALLLYSCESITPELMPEPKEQNEIHIMTKNTVVQTTIRGVERTLGDSVGFKLYVIQLSKGDNVAMLRSYGDSVAVTVHRGYTVQEMGWVIGLFFKF